MWFRSFLSPFPVVPCTHSHALWKFDHPPANHSRELSRRGTALIGRPRRILPSRTPRSFPFLTLFPFLLSKTLGFCLALEFFASVKILRASTPSGLRCIRLLPVRFLLFFPPPAPPSFFLPLRMRVLFDCEIEES